MTDSRSARIILPTILPLLRIMLMTFFRDGQNQDAYAPPKYLHDRYDFIIVGGGTAGCVMASRLSEVHNWKILVLEAGGPPPIESRVPGLSRLFYFPSPATWHYQLAPQRHGLKAYNNRSSPVPHGRVIGGSSTVNGMLYARGSPRDFDHWASLGNPGWDYKSVLPYFIKSESYRGATLPNTERYHGRKGPLPVTPDTSGFFSRAFIRAGHYLGFKHIDPNGPELIGFANPEYTIKRGERWGAARSYLEPASKRPNLHILHSAHVLKIIFNKNKRAVGVVFKYEGKVKAVRATKEVILSAGALASPKILMLSGIGPQNHLAHHGIKTIHNLPGVGKNLQDHACLYGLTWTVRPGLPNDVLNSANPASLSQYIYSRTGSYATPLAEFGHAWESFSTDNPDWPDIQLYMISSGLAQEGVLAAVALGLNERKYLQHFGQLAARQTMTLMPYLARPKSRGVIYLRSKNPLDHPVIDPKFLSHPDDVTTLLKGIEFAMKVSKTPPFVKTLGTHLYTQPLDDCRSKEFGSREYWTCFILHMASTFYHFAGTCKMGPSSDHYSVVDEYLRVHEVSRLRVIDASVMPTVVSANPVASIIMIAERASDLIKQNWSNKQRSEDFVDEKETDYHGVMYFSTQNQTNIHIENASYFSTQNQNEYHYS